MDPDIVVIAENVSKKYSKGLRHVMLYGGADITRDFFGISTDCGKLRKGEFWAINDVSFELKKGETLGLIGQNGSGKSTLLKILNGIYSPDRGRITLHGRIGALIEVSAGFHPMLTGRENIYLNGQILGMTKKEIDLKFDEIIEFADIGDFIDMPVKHYSSGMHVRLGFAIAVHCEPDILLIDEVLAVGDTGFKVKCFNKIGEIRKHGVSSILVSHDMPTISNFCNKVVLLDRGKNEFYGDLEEGIYRYNQHFSTIFKSEGEIEKPISGTDNFIINNVEFDPPMVMNRINANYGQDVEVSIQYKAKKNYNNIIISTALYLPIPYSLPFFQSNNLTFNEKISLKKSEGVIRIRIKKITLNNFMSYLSISLGDGHNELIMWWKRIPIFFKNHCMSNGWSHFDVEYNVSE